MMMKFLHSFAALHECALAYPRKGMWCSLSAFAEKEKTDMNISKTNRVFFFFFLEKHCYCTLLFVLL